jgi:hypothetical protein
VTDGDGADVLAVVDAALAEHFGQRPIRASVTFVGVPPIEVLRFEPIPGELMYATLGMSSAAMTPADAAAVTHGGPRAELLLHVRARPVALTGVWRWLAVLAAAPVVEGVVYGPGMTIDVGHPVALGSRCTGAVVTAGPMPAIATPAATVSLLQVLPATATELAWARVHGAAALAELWRRQAIDLLDVRRQPARPPEAGASS